MNFKNWICACFLLLLSNLTFGQESSTTFPFPSWPEDAIVEAGDLGSIQGAYTYTSPTGKRFFWFAGIPYADPASYMGENRFRPSSLITGPLPGESPFLAVNPLVFCPQRDIFYKRNTNMSDLGSVMWAYKKSLSRESKEEFRRNPKSTGQEDCLVINVNTPKIPRDGDTTLLPVLFFIHGGSFDSIWGGVFGGHRFINRDIVVVTINYRLGLLGSLNLGVDEAPGNAAMYDVITALKWTQKYIHHFGGDNSSVTVSGHSAGAVMATHLLTSPMMKDSNLFHKVIGLSGSAVSAWAVCTDPSSNYLRTAKHADCNQTDNKEIAECMRGKSPDELIDALNKWEDEEDLEGRFGFDAKIPSLQLSPLADTPIFMDETPLNVFLQGKQKDVPVMLGSTRHDGTFVMEGTYDFLRNGGWLEDMARLRNEFFPVLLKGLGLEDSTGGAMIHSMAHAYLGPNAMNSDNFTDMIPGMIDIHSVIAFKAGAYNLLELHSKLNAKSFYFAFDYFGFWTVDGGDVIPGGVGHIDSIFYLFQAFPLVVWPKDLQVSNRFVDYFVNFATYGDPNGPTGSEIVFPPYDPHTHTYLIINGSDKIGYNCRDSWIDNSIEIKDNLRPGWWPGPTWRPLPTEPSTERVTTTTVTPNPGTVTTSTTDATTSPNTGSTSPPTSPPTGPTSPPTSPPTGPTSPPTSPPTGSTNDPTTVPTISTTSFANLNKPMELLIILVTIFNTI